MTVLKKLKSFEIANKLRSRDELISIVKEFNLDQYIPLFNENMDNHVLLEQYRLFTEATENLLQRRQNVNSFYISANTAIITIGSTVFALGADGDFLSKIIVVFVLTIPGILLNISWRRMLHSYFINNQGKMKILSMIEKQLALSIRRRMGSNGKQIQQEKVCFFYG